MKNLTEEELRIAFVLWYREYAFKTVDSEVLPFLSDKIRPFMLESEQPGWLRKARVGLHLAAQAVSDRLGISRGAYAQYEMCEERGTISLLTLAKAAEAMDCELVYAIRAKNRKPFSMQIWQILLESTAHHGWLKNCVPHRRGYALADLMMRRMSDAKFRRNQSWSQRRRG